MKEIIKIYQKNQQLNKGALIPLETPSFLRTENTTANWRNILRLSAEPYGAILTRNVTNWITLMLHAQLHFLPHLNPVYHFPWQ